MATRVKISSLYGVGFFYILNLEVVKMKLLYGTTNKSKIIFMRSIVSSLGIEIIDLEEVGNPKIDIDESGNVPLENAKIKALAYYNALKIPVFSCDSGLYIEGLEDSRQPGVHIRRVKEMRLDDGEMITYYSSLAKEFGGKMKAKYQNAICLITEEGEVHSYMGEDIASEPFLIVSKPHKKRREGFPLDSLSVSIKHEKYYYDLESHSKDDHGIINGFPAFFKRTLNL